jgi:hypothetical protein
MFGCLNGHVFWSVDVVTEVAYLGDIDWADVADVVDVVFRRPHRLGRYGRCG